MKKVEQIEIVLLYDRSNFVQVLQNIRRSAFYPSFCKFCPQFTGSTIRRSTSLHFTGDRVTLI